MLPLTSSDGQALRLRSVLALVLLSSVIGGSGYRRPESAAARGQLSCHTKGPVRARSGSLVVFEHGFHVLACRFRTGQVTALLNTEYDGTRLDGPVAVRGRYVAFPWFSGPGASGGGNYIELINVVNDSIFVVPDDGPGDFSACNSSGCGFPYGVSGTVVRTDGAVAWVGCCDGDRFDNTYHLYEAKHGQVYELPDARSPHDIGRRLRLSADHRRLEWTDAGHLRTARLWPPPATARHLHEG